MRALVPVAAVVACLIAWATTAQAQEAGAVAKVVQQRGVVTVLRVGSPSALRLGAPLNRGDRILTGPDSGVQIEFTDGSRLSVGPRSKVDIAEYLDDGAGHGVKAVLSLVIGILRASLAGSPWGEGFEVRTRAAIASVRSTDWIVEAREDRASVFVVAGRVEVTALFDRSRVVLDKGFGTDVAVGAGPTPPKQWGAGRVQEVLERTRVP